MRAFLLPLIAAAGLSGCSLLYDIGQERALDQCDRATSPQDRTACRKANSESYEDYEKRRQAAKEGRAP
ncbi:hypothetical protein [Roseateles sp. BYS78W]|uniref:hypothetical protein n=1 Tax=Pelomonas candidula TaxID=3299025 RepID=UPI00374A170A